MTRHALTIATGWRRTDRRILALGVFVAMACGGSPPVNTESVARQVAPETEAKPMTDEAWVASACDAASIDTTGWRRYRVLNGDLTIQAPAQYSQAGMSTRPQSFGTDYYGYDLLVRGPGGSIVIQLHRNARYTFDRANAARRNQKWCTGSLGGYQAEIVSWLEPFAGNRRDTRAGELIIGATYNFAARFPASWGGQDQGKWVFIYMGASRLADAQRLRDALHTISAVKSPGGSR